MLLRKRALALRKFTVIRREDGMPLEEDQEFRFSLPVCESASLTQLTSRYEKVDSCNPGN